MKKDPYKLLVVTYASAAFLGLLSIFLFELMSGPHLECGVNDSVGPCDFWGRIVSDLPLAFIASFFYWFGLVVTWAIAKFLWQTLRRHK